MHRASAIYWVVQLVGWGLFCAMIAITSYISGDFKGNTPFKLIELYVFLVLVTHGMRYLLVRLNWVNLKLTPLIPRVLILNFSASIVLLLLINTSSVFLFGESFIPLIEFIINSLLYTIFFVMWSAVYLTYHLLRKSRKQELQNLKLEASHHEIELKTLRDQLNPHFLFNSLNSIRALIEIDPTTAKSAITNLSNLLRNSLQMGKKSQVTISEEVNLVKEYLRLEKIRFEERLAYNIDVEVNDRIEIPPFLIQTMAENGIKHGISKNTTGGVIDIRIYKQKENLNLEVTNTGGKFAPNDIEGIGIINTKRRLAIQYGDNAGFSIKNEKDRVVALVWINQNQFKNKIS
jgi:two-component system LytT family sensor kinase